MVGIVRDVIRRGFPRRESAVFDVIERRGAEQLLLALASRHDVGDREGMREVDAALARGRVVVPQSRADRRQHVVRLVNAAILVSHHHHHLLAHHVVVRDVIARR